jgi:hypothetical protein
MTNRGDFSPVTATTLPSPAHDLRIERYGLFQKFEEFRKRIEI